MPVQSPNRLPFKTPRRVYARIRTSRATIRAQLVREGVKLTHIARAVGIPRQRITDYFAGRDRKIGRDHKKKIEEWLIESGFKRRPKPRTPLPTCTCKTCGKTHKQPRRVVAPLQKLRTEYPGSASINAI